MCDGNEKQNKMEQLARDVLNLSRNTLLVNLRFLDLALSHLELVSDKDTSLRTDAQRIYYSPMHVLRNYKAEKEIPVRDYLHMVLHCVFRHMFADPAVNHGNWNLACDIAVENIISDLHLKSAAASREKEQEAALEKLRQELPLVTAEKVYAYLQTQSLDDETQKNLQRIFLADDHQYWFPPETHSEAVPDEEDDGDPDETGPATNGEDTEETPDPDAPQGTMEALSEEWKEIAEKLQTDLRTFSKDQGDRAGAMMQNLRAVNRTKTDYATFLRKFTSLGEVMKINDDEFDYIFYTYGLKLYQNMPLVEPLEYKDVRKIKEFVIAIDTSGSTSGELVQKFVEKTYEILKSTETFFSKINLHIIQCDTEIQEHVKITSQEEFDDYLKKMSIHGQGGTDFRPVFELVDQMIAQREFQNLRGLIYFTDGYGTFPARKPVFETAFVFLNDSYEIPLVPPWAIRLVLQKDEI